MSTVRNDRQKNNRALRTTLTKPPVQSWAGALRRRRWVGWLAAAVAGSLPAAPAQAASPPCLLFAGDLLEAQLA